MTTTLAGTLAIDPEELLFAASVGLDDSAELIQSLLLGAKDAPIPVDPGDDRRLSLAAVRQDVALRLSQIELAARLLDADAALGAAAA